jgi:glycosyltransferase involved in cell wall biosynthesis
MKKKIAVIIPSYNVEKQIEIVIRTLPGFVDKIIVVDDCSKDNTSEVVRRLNDSRVTLVRHEKNQGVGGAVLTGYAEATKQGADILVKMDGDGQMKPEYLDALVKPLEEGKAHYAKGNRFSDAEALERMPSLRRFGNAWLSFATKMVSGYWNSFDVVNGFTALLTSTYKRLDKKAIAKSYFFETSMLVELNIVGARIVDVDMPPFYEDEHSHLRIRRIASYFPFLLIRSFFRRFYRKYVLRDFNILTICVLTGFPLFSFGMIYGINLWLHPPVYGQPTPAGTVMLAALPIIIGFQLLLTSLILDVVFVPKEGPASHDR